MTYYLKYRPQKLSELDLTDVREELLQLVKSKKIPHAFLFSGPKGTGKTSAARILAKVINCENRKAKSTEPCNRCMQCKSITNGSNVDVIELDAASHRGIDDVRVLRDAVKLASANAPNKVYIIDEAHMLTKEASNALLKTLEEPPEHVMFILATTEPEKLIETIRSRTVQIKFPKATTDEIVRSLKRVATGEKIKVDKESLRLIAQASNGSFRDASKILEQLTTNKKSLKGKAIEEYLFKTETYDADSFLGLLYKRDVKGALSAIEDILAQGGAMKLFAETIVARLREALMSELGLTGNSLPDFGKDELIFLIKLFDNAQREIPGAVLEQIPLEIAVVEWCEVDFGDREPSEADDETKVAPTLQKVHKEKIKKIPAEPESVKRKQVKSLNKKVWAQLLSSVRPKNTSTEALLRASKPLAYDGEVLEIGVFYNFHKERLEMPTHSKILEDTLHEILGNSVRVICTLTEGPEKAVEKTLNKEKTGPQASTLTETDDEDIISIAKDIFEN